MDSSTRVLRVNLGVRRTNPAGASLSTGIDRRPTTEAMQGGDEQAVYACARMDLDRWGPELGRQLVDGGFGEDLTTTGIDVNATRVGERCAPRRSRR